MSLYNGIDPTAIASHGVYTETYGVGEEGNLANLYGSFGLLENAPEESIIELLKQIFFGGFF